MLEMRKIIYTTFIISILLVVSACSKSNDTNEITKILSEKNIVEIKVSTQMTSKKQDVVLNEEYWGKLLDKFNSFSLKQIDEEKKNGWQYLFKIEQKEDVVTLISFMEDRVTIDGTVYEVEGYNSNDFLYLFE